MIAKMSPHTATPTRDQQEANTYEGQRERGHPAHKQPNKHRELEVHGGLAVLLHRREFALLYLSALSVRQVPALDINLEPDSVAPVSESLTMQP
jgi:hypothetical protein